MGKLETLDSDDEMGRPWWPDLETGALDHWFLSNSLILHSFKFMDPKFLLINFRCHARWKRIYGALILHCSSYISKIVWWLPMFDLVFSVIYIDSWDNRVGASVRVFEKFRSLCSFLHFLFVFFFYFFWGGLSRGPLYLRGPCTLSTHATQLLRHWRGENIRTCRELNPGPS